MGKLGSMYGELTSINSMGSDQDSNLRPCGLKASTLTTAPSCYPHAPSCYPTVIYNRHRLVNGSCQQNQINGITLRLFVRMVPENLKGLAQVCCIALLRVKYHFKSKRIYIEMVFESRVSKVYICYQFFNFLRCDNSTCEESWMVDWSTL